jgi:hypothetical protein
MSAFLTEVTKIVVCVTDAEGASGTGDITGDIVDTAGFDGAAVFCAMGSISAGAVTTLKVQQGDAAAMGDAETLGTDAQASIAVDDDNTVVCVDIRRVEKRYIRPLIDRGTAAAEVMLCWVVLYNARQGVVADDGLEVVARAVTPVV